MERTPRMVRHWVAVLVGTGMLLAANGPVRAACLPTLGTDDCLRWDYFQIQPLWHRYLDTPTRREPGSRRAPSQKKATAGAK